MLRAKATLFPEEHLCSREHLEFPGVLLTLCARHRLEGTAQEGPSLPPPECSLASSKWQMRRAAQTRPHGCDQICKESGQEGSRPPWLKPNVMAQATANHNLEKQSHCLKLRSNEADQLQVGGWRCAGTSLALSLWMAQSLVLLLLLSLYQNFLHRAEKRQLPGSRFLSKVTELFV